MGQPSACETHNIDLLHQLLRGCRTVRGSPLYDQNETALTRKPGQNRRQTPRLCRQIGGRPEFQLPSRAIYFFVEDISDLIKCAGLDWAPGRVRDDRGPGCVRSDLAQSRDWSRSRMSSLHSKNHCPSGRGSPTILQPCPLPADPKHERVYPRARKEQLQR